MAFFITQFNLSTKHLILKTPTISDFFISFSGGRFSGIILFFASNSLISLLFLTCSFVIFGIGKDIYKILANDKKATTTLNIIKSKRKKIGSHIIHFGVAVAVIGITASMSHKTDVGFSLEKNQKKEIGKYTVVLDSLEEKERAGWRNIKDNYSGCAEKRSSHATETTARTELNYTSVKAQA
jgi:cytochrome c biogenesis factor